MPRTKPLITFISFTTHPQSDSFHCAHTPCFLHRPRGTGSSSQQSTLQRRSQVLPITWPLLTPRSSLLSLCASLPLLCSAMSPGAVSPTSSVPCSPLTLRLYLPRPLMKTAHHAQHPQPRSHPHAATWSAWWDNSVLGTLSSCELSTRCWLVSAGNVAGVAEETNVFIYFISDMLNSNRPRRVGRPRTRRCDPALRSVSSWGPGVCPARNVPCPELHPAHGRSVVNISRPGVESALLCLSPMGLKGSWTLGAPQPLPLVSSKAAVPQAS